MSGPYHEVDFPLHKKFVCDICGYDTLTKNGMWNHLDKKHPELDALTMDKKIDEMTPK